MRAKLKGFNAKSPPSFYTRSGLVFILQLFWALRWRLISNCPLLEREKKGVVIFFSCLSVFSKKIKNSHPSVFSSVSLSFFKKKHILNNFKKRRKTQFKVFLITMASDLFPFDGSFFSDQFSPFTDSIDILQELENNPIQENPIDEISCLDQIASTLLSNSPPSRQLGNLSLYQTPSHLGNSPDFNSMEVKTEECQFPCFYSSSYDYNNNGSSFMMQRSYSSHSFDGRRSGFLFQPGFGSLVEESHSFQSQLLRSSPENGFSSGQVRRACSTGDLQVSSLPLFLELIS